MELIGRGVGRHSASGVAVLMPPRQVGVHPGAAPGSDDAETALSRIRTAIESAAAGLRERAAASCGGAREILDAQAVLVADPELIGRIERNVHNGVTPPIAVTRAAAALARELEEAGGVFAERADDLEDVARLVVARLAGRPLDLLPELPPGSILVAEELRPHEASRLDPDAVVGVVVLRAAPASHTSLILGELGIPAVVSCAEALRIPAGAPVTIDPLAGIVHVDVSGATVAMGGALRAPGAARDRARPAGTPATGMPTTDGSERRSASHGSAEPEGAAASGPVGPDSALAVRTLVNLGSIAAAERAARMGAEGIGLLRTELLFLDRADEPAVAEQTEVYTRVFEQFRGRPVVARLFDCDADKPLPFLGMDERTSAALGVRGIRLLRANAPAVARQLEALQAAQAATGVRLGIVAPMVADVEDAEFMQELCRDAGIEAIGAHIEVPSAAILLDEFLGRVKFVSIGTNDLLQFLLAADRHLGVLARYQDQWHPALLRTIARVAAEATQAGLPVTVCGNAAADPRLAVVLAGLGIGTLSMPASAIGPVREALAAVDAADAKDAATRALRGRSAAECRDLAFPQG